MKMDKTDLARIRTSDELEPFVSELEIAAEAEFPRGDVPTFLRHVQAVLRSPQAAGLPDESDPSWAWMAQLLAASYQRMKTTK